MPLQGFEMFEVLERKWLALTLEVNTRYADYVIRSLPDSRKKEVWMQMYEYQTQPLLVCRFDSFGIPQIVSEVPHLHSERTAPLLSLSWTKKIQLLTSQ